MLRFIYNFFLPVGFLFFLPGLIYKLRNRGGWKSTFGERFGRFSVQRKSELAAYRGAIWIHAVSVGETVVALGMIKRYLERFPERKFVLSTTTTTGQELARSRCPGNTAVIFCPIDFPGMVKRTFDVISPSLMVIFETEIWPNMLYECRKRGIPAALVNGRMSDHSASGYRKCRVFFAPLLRKFNVLMVQTEADCKRYKSISPDADTRVCGNMKFDQKPPENLEDPHFENYFGEGERTVLLAASTHPGEEEFIAENFIELQKKFPNLKLVLVPRHAERGADLANMLKKMNLNFSRRSTEKTPPPHPVDVLLADTTGEMMKLMNGADIVIMGKSLAGHDEGHNLIEPALLNKPIVTGHVLRNFRFILNALLEADAVAAVTADSDLPAQLEKLLADPGLRWQLGERAGAVIARHRGATDRTIDELEKLLVSCQSRICSKNRG